MNVQHGGKKYVGDGVYVAHDGFSLVVTTEDGYQATNRIIFEPDVWQHLLICVEEIKSMIDADITARRRLAEGDTENTP